MALIPKRPASWAATAVAFMISVALVPLTGGSASAQVPMTVSLRATSRAEIGFGSAVGLHGVVATSGTPTPGVPVELQAKQFPYTKPFRAAGSTTTNQNGAYHFRKSPSHNTKYRVVVTADPSQHSGVRTVYVVANFVHCGGVYYPTRAIVHCSLRYPRDVQEQGRNAYWYLGLNHARRDKHVATTRLPAPVQPGLIRVRHVFTYSASPGSNIAWAVMIRHLPSQGLGQAACLDHFGYWAGGKPSCAPPASLNAKTGKP